MAGTELDPTSYDPVVAGHVDTAEVPSAAWGWSGEAPRLFRFAGWFFAGFLLLMIIGNHEGRVEDWFLVGFAGLMVLVLVRDMILRRKPR
ncbi:DUF2631 domain-containing protein [Rhodococcus spongiicola]|uniref:DUF2631 domain-containing protein n=1 Tax=Rhodococcus spongiicola TaxID=2487352 RepID=A0A3S3ALQ2_9NOCA|nr:DUF2631 domain-containing protein [Rhodococcus spongiicola]RVW03638.1 DUF2631 domain-containing protein [Rhodococcus spongiicola]